MFKLTNTRKPDICLREKGVINLSSNVSKALDLKQGDVVSIAEDLHENEFYLYVAQRNENKIGNYIGECKTSKRSSSHIRVNSVTLYNVIKDKIGADKIDLIVGELIELPSLGKCLPIIMSNRYDRRD